MKSKTEEVAQQNNYFFIGDVMTAVETKITDEDKSNCPRNFLTI